MPYHFTRLLLPVLLVFALSYQAGGQAKSYKEILREQKASAKAREKLERAAQSGDLTAGIQLGDTALAHGYQSDAKKWYRDGYNKGNPHCAYGMGAAFLMLPSKAEADSGIYYLNIAVKRGSPEAMLLLGSCYHGGHKEDVAYNPDYRYSFTKDTEKGLALCRQAAALGYKPAQEKLDLYDLAGGNPNLAGYNAYKNGNNRLAYKLWIIGAVEEQDPPAMYSLGIMALKGQMPTDIVDTRNFHTPRGNDPRTAREWFQTAGGWGYADGSYRAGEIWNSLGERGAAMEWWTKAAAQGYEGAAERVAQTKSDVANDQARRAADARAYNASYESRWEKYTKQSVNTGTRPASTTTWGTPDKTALERDQEMYDKMHREADQREKTYNDKWGR